MVAILFSKLFKKHLKKSICIDDTKVTRSKEEGNMGVLRSRQNHACFSKVCNDIEGCNSMFTYFEVIIYSNYFLRLLRERLLLIYFKNIFFHTFSVL